MVKIIRARDSASRPQESPEDYIPKQPTTTQALEIQSGAPQRGMLEEVGRKTIAPFIGAAERSIDVNLGYKPEEISEYAKLQQKRGITPEQIEKTSQEQRQTRFNPSEEYLQPLTKKHLPEGFTKPEGLVEEALHSTASNLPFLLMGGGGLGAKIAKDLVQSGVMKSLEKGGAGVTAQLAGGLLAGHGFNKASSAAKKLFNVAKDPETLFELAKASESKLWSQAEKLAPQATGDSKAYSNKLTDFYHKIKESGSIKEESKNELLKKAKLIQDDIRSGKISALKIQDRIKEINELYPSTWDPAINKGYRELQKIMFLEAESIGKSHPEWHAAWSGARDVRKALNFLPSLKEISEKYPKVTSVAKSGLVKSILGLGGAYGAFSKPGYALGAAAAGAAANKLYSETSMRVGFMAHPSTRHLMQQAMENAADRNFPLLTKAIGQLDQNAEKYETSYKKKVGIRSPGKGVKIIRASDQE